MKYIISILFAFFIGNDSWSQTIVNFNPTYAVEGDTEYVIDEFRFYISNLKFILKNGKSIQDSEQALLQF